MPAPRARCGRGGILLPAGVRAVEGAFERGDAVEVCGPDGAAAGARPVGLCAAPTRRGSSATAAGEIEAILGWRGRDEMIHRDDLVLFEALPG